MQILNIQMVLSLSVPASATSSGWKSLIKPQQFIVSIMLQFYHYECYPFDSSLLVGIIYHLQDCSQLQDNDFCWITTSLYNSRSLNYIINCNMKIRHDCFQLQPRFELWDIQTNQYEALALPLSNITNDNVKIIFQKIK